MRIGDWSSNVCSSDLVGRVRRGQHIFQRAVLGDQLTGAAGHTSRVGGDHTEPLFVGERVVPDLATLGVLALHRVPGALEPLVGPGEDERAGESLVVDQVHQVGVDLHGLLLTVATMIEIARATYWERELPYGQLAGDDASVK